MASNPNEYLNKDSREQQTSSQNQPQYSPQVSPQGWQVSQDPSQNLQASQRDLQISGQTMDAKNQPIPPRYDHSQAPPPYSYEQPLPARVYPPFQALPATNPYLTTTFQHSQSPSVEGLFPISNFGWSSTPSPQQAVPYAYTTTQSWTPFTGGFGPHSQATSCRYCGANIRTTVRVQPDWRTHTMALVLCFCCLCFLPYVLDCWQSVNHYCPNCNKMLGSYLP